ncbi:hypothetical protein ACHQM5_010845 [Ranunculus cassubicifolius]
MESTMKKLKFVCSYGGMIEPSSCDGSLRYHGGETRILAVPRSINFAELSLKLAEMRGGSLVILRCKLPNEDLDFLVTIRSDEELQNLVQDYELLARTQTPNSTELKIKAFLFPWQPKIKTLSSPPLHRNKTPNPPPIMRPPSSSTTVAGKQLYQPATISSRKQTLGSEGMIRYWVPVPNQHRQPQIISRSMKTGYNYTGGFPQQHINFSSHYGLAC